MGAGEGEGPPDLFEMLRGGRPRKRIRVIGEAPSAHLRNAFQPLAFGRYFLAGLLAFFIIGLLGLPMLAAHVHVNIWWFESIGLGPIYGRTWSTEKYLFLLYGF